MAGWLVGWSVLVCAFVCAFVSAFVCSFRGLFACVLSWVEIVRRTLGTLGTMCRDNNRRHASPRYHGRP